MTMNKINRGESRKMKSRSKINSNPIATKPTSEVRKPEIKRKDNVKNDRVFVFG